MTQSTSKPEKITKPIQLLAAWLAGLLSIDTCFLVAATHLQVDSWEARALVIAAIGNVPLFLLAVFLLQTKFRPEMQEDSFYSTYLSRKTNQLISVNKDNIYFAQISQQLSEIEERLVARVLDVKSQTLGQLSGDVHALSSQVDTKELFTLSSLDIGVNKGLPDYEEIGQKMRSFGVVGYRGFGEAGSPPSGRIVAISQFLANDVVREVVRVAQNLGFTHYNRFNNALEEIKEEVLFGAYGEAEYEIAG